MYELQISIKAQREIKKIARTNQKAVLEALYEISINPFSGKPLTRELNERFSYKIGVFRIVYSINKRDKIVKILAAGHRSTVYKY